MKIIFLTGYPRSGKDEFCKILRESYPGLKIDTAAFADKLKLVHMSRLGIESLDIYNNHLHTTGMYGDVDMREGLSVLGKELKHKDHEVFVKHVKKRIKQSQADIFVVTDMRYIEEYHYAKRINATMIRIFRNTLPDKEARQPWNSLTQVFQVHHVIYNTMSLPVYRDRVIEAVTNLGVLSNK